MKLTIRIYPLCSKTASNIVRKDFSTLQEANDFAIAECEKNGSVCNYKITSSVKILIAATFCNDNGAIEYHIGDKMFRGINTLPSAKDLI